MTRDERGLEALSPDGGRLVARNEAVLKTYYARLRDGTLTPFLRVAGALSAVRRAEDDRTEVLNRLASVRPFRRDDWSVRVRAVWWAEARAARTRYRVAVAELRAANGALGAANGALGARKVVA